MKHYLGVDIGGTAVKLGVVRQDGHLEKTRESPINYDLSQNPILSSTIQAIDDFLSHIDVELVGIGVSATGQINTNTGMVIGTCGNIPNYIGTDFKTAFESRYQLPCTVVNDANCMVLGEKWVGAAAHHRYVVGITLGTGVGGGVLIDDRLLLGAHGIAGEVGHIVVNAHGPKCTCGNYGCFEQVASTSSLIRRIRQIEGVPSDLDGRWIFEQAQLGHPWVQSCLTEWIRDMTDGFVSLVHTFNPTCIVIGGGVSAQTEWLINPLRKAILERVMPRFADDLTIVSATLGNNAGLIGAIYYFIHLSDNV